MFIEKRIVERTSTYENNCKLKKHLVKDIVKHTEIDLVNYSGDSGNPQGVLKRSEAGSEK